MTARKPNLPQFDPAVIGVLHPAGQVWRVLVASTKGSRPAVLAHRDFPIAGAGQVDSWLNEHKVGAVMCVLPTASIICRNCPLPNAPPDQLAQALGLQAEAHLLGIAPPHRLAMAVLPPAPGETSRNGLVLAWPETATVAVPPTSRPVTYVPDIAAMAAILNGQRPTEAVLWLDRHNGSMAVALAHAAGVIFRCTREDAESAEAWQASAGRVVAETALKVSHTGPFIELLVADCRQRAATLSAQQAGLFLPQELINSASSRMEGVSSDAQWWMRYGIAAGALLARCGPLQSLTHMLNSPPIESPSRVKSALDALSRPRFAAKVVIACIILLMIGPLAFGSLRWAALKVRYGIEQEQLRAAISAKNQVAIYQELERQKAWPMTKLLADIACNTPIGIELEQIRIEAGKDFAISGTAIAHEDRTPAQLIALMQENLGKARMFSDIVVTAGKSDNLGRYKFDLSAKVTKPYFNPPYGEEIDYAVKSYRHRLFGPPPDAMAAAASVTAVPGGDERGDPPHDSRVRTSFAESGDPDDPGDGGAEAGESPEGGLVESNGSDGGQPSYRTNRSGTRMPGIAPPGPNEERPNPRPVPPPRSEQAIAVMSNEEARAALAEIGSARKNPDLDEETKTRLRKEWDLLLAKMRKAAK